jgi:hypothetical protein
MSFMGSPRNTNVNVLLKRTTRISPCMCSLLSYIHFSIKVASILIETILFGILDIFGRARSCSCQDGTARMCYSDAEQSCEAR